MARRTPSPELQKRLTPTRHLLRIRSMTRVEAELPLCVWRPLCSVRNGPPRHPDAAFAKRAFAPHRHCGCADGPPRKLQRLQPSAGEQPLLQPEVHSRSEEHTSELQSLTN